MFENLNEVGQKLEFLESGGAQELLNMIKSITLPLRIISIYSQGGKHFAWILTDARIIKKKQKPKGE